MGKIINVDFGNRMPVSKLKEEKNLKKVGKGDKDQLTGEYSSKNKERLTEAMIKIQSLPISQNALRMSAEMIKNYSIDDLWHWLNDSSEKDWVAKPAFFRAIIERIVALAEYNKN